MSRPPPLPPGAPRSSLRSSTRDSTRSSPRSSPRSGPSDRAELGRQGEAVAAEFLEGRGYRIVGRNVRADRVEIDLIARRGVLLVFVEVKTRRSLKMGSPAEAVDARKQRRLRRGASAWLSSRPASARGVRRLRFDVVTCLHEGLAGPADEPSFSPSFGADAMEDPEAQPDARPDPPRGGASGLQHHVNAGAGPSRSEPMGRGRVGPACVRFRQMRASGEAVSWQIEHWEDAFS
ncbi:MAG TPA: YraN family protein [Myxococcota bacterium]|nr:YraN family protein [Myxococcota bacterium]